MDTFGWVRAVGPAAVVVDSTKWETPIDSLMTYTARPRYIFAARPTHTGDVQPAGSAVAFAPLTYSEYQGWENTIHALNLGLDQPAKVKVTLLDRSGDIIGSFVEWVCPGGAKSFFLPMLAGLPGNWVGMVRIESMAYRMSDGTWRDPPPIQAVAEMLQWATTPAGDEFLASAIAYECLAEPEALDWSSGSDPGGLASGIGVIALPIMMSQGIPARVAAPTFTMGIGAGAFVNLVQFGTFEKLFPGIKYEAPWLTYWTVAMCVYIACAWLMIYLNLRKLGVRRQARVDTAGQAARKRTH